MMKRIALLTIALTVLAGCTMLEKTRNKEFTHSGCASNVEYAPGVPTKADSDVSLLTLKYEDGDLRVTRTNASMNCSINKHGMECNVSVKGDVIYYEVIESDGPTANCNCLVKEMSSVVTGLQTGKKYKFHYFCSHGYNPFEFEFEKGLRLVVDLTPHYTTYD
jgi:hypothetical protein